MAPGEAEAGSGSVHIPVLVREVVALLAPGPGMVVLDATVGAGGHAAALLESVPGPLVYLGLDRDAEILAVAGRRLAPFGERVRLFHSEFSRLREVVEDAGYHSVDRILFDLGVSSFALDLPERGFGIMASGPLDMRMDRGGGETAADLVARLPERELAELIARYGEDRYARRIARALVEARQKAPITTTSRLAEVVARAVPRPPQARGRGSQRRLHPATRAFQALRIAVNRELDQLGEGLEAARAVLSPGGRVAVLSFHSLEDRMVKRFFRERLVPLVKRPVRPSAEEVAANGRSRSARLRAAASPPAEGGGA